MSKLHRISWRATAALSVVVGLGAFVFFAPAHAADSGVALPKPAYDPAPASHGSAEAVLAGGCFWGIQAVFEHVKGVTRVVAGYAGGSRSNPTYEQVSSETSGYAESVQITYDPSTVSYGTLLQVFFSVGHDPTELNRQGPDVGTSYRSDIFYKTDAQEQVAKAYIAQLDGAHLFPRPIVTRLDRFMTFYPAEDYHQDFLIKHPDYPYIVVNDLPKLANFARLLPSVFEKAPTRVSGPLAPEIARD